MIRALLRPLAPSSKTTLDRLTMNHSTSSQRSRKRVTSELACKSLKRRSARYNLEGMHQPLKMSDEPSEGASKVNKASVSKPKQCRPQSMSSASSGMNASKSSIGNETEVKPHVASSESAQGERVTNVTKGTQRMKAGPAIALVSAPQTRPLRPHPAFLPQQFRFHPRYPHQEMIGQQWRGGQHWKGFTGHQRLARPPPSTSDGSLTWVDSGLGAEIRAGRQRSAKGATEFVIVSWNILADQLVTLHPELYTNVEKEDLPWETRYPRLLKILHSLDPDIICLQEVEPGAFKQLQKDLDGFGGVFKGRTGDKPDGCATFFKRSKFHLVEECSVEFCKTAVVSWLDRDNVGLILRLRSVAKPANELLVANTHLLYNPNRHDIKLAQTILLLTELDRMGSAAIGHDGECKQKTPTVVMGDFNLTEESAVYDFLTGGYLNYEGLDARSLTRRYGGRRLGSMLLPPELGVTDSCTVVSPNKKKEGEIIASSLSQGTEGVASTSRGKRVTGGGISSGQVTHDLKLKAVYRNPKRLCSTRQGPWITVDHMFYSGQRYQNHQQQQDHLVEDRLKLLRRLRLPNASELEKKNLYIPCGEEYPSDHLPLAAQFLLLPSERTQSKGRNPSKSRRE